MSKRNHANSSILNGQKENSLGNHVFTPPNYRILVHIDKIDTYDNSTFVSERQGLWSISENNMLKNLSLVPVAPHSFNYSVRIAYNAGYTMYHRTKAIKKSDFSIKPRFQASMNRHKNRILVVENKDQKLSEQVAADLRNILRLENVPIISMRANSTGIFSEVEE